MRTIIEKSALLKALNHVQSVVERRNTIPILSNVLLQAQGGSLSLTATDLEIEIREKIEADVHQEGAVTAPAHMLYDIVRKLADGAQVELSLDADAGRLNLSSGPSHFTLQTLPKDDFPAMSQDEMPVTFALPAEQLQSLIDRTRFAISSEETRYYLNGIYLHTVEEGGRGLLRAVATDGHRLAQAQINQPVGAAGMPSIIVPRKTVNETQKLLEEAGGEVSVQLSDTRINFAFESIVLTSKLIDGKFPDYTRVIPSSNDKTLSVDVRAFKQSVDRVAAISSEKSRAVKLMLDNDRLMFSVSNPDGGSASDELSVAYDAASLEIGFNARYLLDIMGQIEGETASMELADAGSPTIVRDLADKDALYVLMPMRV
ncbi:DNA polymerase III subunit beta [Alphaproteobacteria bacterium]|nr:DNA polymerase III subunit beta [Alphaproteobacteria bacterium]